MQRVQPTSGVGMSLDENKEPFALTCLRADRKQCVHCAVRTFLKSCWWQPTLNLAETVLMKRDMTSTPPRCSSAPSAATPCLSGATSWSMRRGGYGPAGHASVRNFHAGSRVLMGDVARDIQQRLLSASRRETRPFWRPRDGVSAPKSIAWSKMLCPAAQTAKVQTDLTPEPCCRGAHGLAG